MASYERESKSKQNHICSVHFKMARPFANFKIVISIFIQRYRRTSNLWNIKSHIMFASLKAWLQSLNHHRNRCNTHFDRIECNPFEHLRLSIFILSIIIGSGGPLTIWDGIFLSCRNVRHSKEFGDRTEKKKRMSWNYSAAVIKCKCNDAWSRCQTKSHDI